MKLVVRVCCFECSCLGFLWNSPEFKLPFVYSVVGGTLREKRGLRDRSSSNDERRSRTLLFPLDEFANWDLQSYLSHLHLFLASETDNFYILVDNRPWLKDLASLSTHWWQLMVTKSRLSPFANTRGMKERKMDGELSELPASSSPPNGKARNLREWFSVIDAVLVSRKDALLPVKKLTNSLIANGLIQRTLYGFIVFEVRWSNVRGINYYNELQTDTSVAVEAKIMQRWEFDSIAQAVRSISSWFPGTIEEQIILKEHLVATLGKVYYDAQESIHETIDANAHEATSDVTNESPCSSAHTPSVCPETTGIIKNTHHAIPSQCEAEHDSSSREAKKESDQVCSKTCGISGSEEKVEATIYRDVLILFRFNDPFLPFNLRDIIMSKLWLLTLLEAGLPSWVIFLQSYPGFCRLYRPWMCPLARGLYVLISVITVLIGFYDLYKNVPLLKATVSRMFGPLFDWIDAWEMTSRIQYLGTMLFLHNFQKAMRWFLTATRTVFSILSFVVAPMARPFAEFIELFFPLWNMFVPVAQDFFTVIWTVIESSFTMIGDVLEIFLLPVWYFFTVAWNLATTFVYPVAWVFVYAPFRLLYGFCSIVMSSCTITYALIRDMWMSARGIFQVTRSVHSTVSTVEISMWRSLWNDLFSHVFRALRSILNGLVAFLAACNRHRLSIYNHAREFTKRSLRATKSAWPQEKAQGRCTQTPDSKSDARPWKESSYRMRKSKKAI